jgi:hypothetical protein
MRKFYFKPLDWYWKAEDGRIYSSAKQALVPTDDPDFIAWQGDEPKAEPQIWPHDDDGNQTTASMQAVMDEYGRTVPG